MTVSLHRRALLAAASLSIPALLPGGARAQTRFPQRELTWLIYQSPGGSIDLNTRTVQPFVEAKGFKSTLDYATGAGGRVARNKLFSARADGHTIMTEVAPGVSVDTALFDVPYKASDFAPLYGWVASPGQLCTKKDGAIRNIADFVAECGKRRVVVGSIGRGGAHHLQLLALRRDLGVNYDIVHFNGSSAAYAAVSGGHIDAACSGAASASRALDSLYVFAMISGKRAVSLPDVPTAAEQGKTVQSVVQLFFASIRSAVPAERRAALTAAFRDAFKDPDLAARMERQGEELTLMEPEDVQRRLSTEQALIEEFKDALKV
ncbi:MAG: transporter substrate-binding protein [Roseomonas sp.]|nr:transporter substrate-binding protein [Roseomonas sp.]